MTRMLWSKQRTWRLAVTATITAVRDTAVREEEAARPPPLPRVALFRPRVSSPPVLRLSRYPAPNATGSRPAVTLTLSGAVDAARRTRAGAKADARAGDDPDLGDDALVEMLPPPRRRRRDPPPVGARTRISAALADATTVSTLPSPSRSTNSGGGSRWPGWSPREAPREAGASPSANAPTR